MRIRNRSILADQGTAHAEDPYDWHGMIKVAGRMSLAPAAGRVGVGNLDQIEAFVAEQLEE